MSGFDEGAVHTVAGPNQLRTDDGERGGGLHAGEDADRQTVLQTQEILAGSRKFILEYRRTEFSFPYREALRTNYEQGRYFIELNVEDLRAYDRVLYRQLCEKPAFVVPLMERAAREVLDELIQPRPAHEQHLPDMQMLFRTSGKPESLRMLGAEHVKKLVKIHGIIVSASSVKARAVKLTLQCRSCRTTLPEIEMKHGFESYALPRKCMNSEAMGAAGRPACPLDPYFILPDKCSCIDIQTLKLQENPTDVPVGELPRHMTLYCERSLTDRVVPGNRITVLGIYSIKSFGRADQQRSAKVPYIRVLGLQVDNTVASGAGGGGGGGGGIGESTFTKDDQVSDEQREIFRQFAATGHAYKTIVASIAPSIYGYDDIKKAIACLLFSGSRKRLPDGLPRRGDINVLLLGDPGVAKSQLLKFVERVAPIGVYTSGKGSSAAGLTAAVLRDPQTNAFTIEGGAMVLADGGVVCIDEFDKMRDEDRVAIHEAMEQQTISIAKAGITTTLNSRCAVLAAANSVYGRWDDTKGDENIDLMPTILSRFDMIFLVKDVHDVARDTRLAKHVMNVHIHTKAADRGGDDAAMMSGIGGGGAAAELQEEAEEMDFVPGQPLPMRFLRNYISFCRRQCGPRLTESAAQKLRNQFVAMRTSVLEKTAQSMRDTKGKFHSIPITIRQLEAVVRIAEALAKMELKPFALESHVDEALRLFQVSTLTAAISGCLAGVEEFTSNVDQEMLARVEMQLKARFTIGSQVSEFKILRDFVNQKMPEYAIRRVIQCLVKRGELQYRMQRRLLYRVR